MKFDFLTLFNKSNSIKNKETNEITITASSISAEGEYQITSPCKITSSSNTTVKCDIIEIFSPSVTFSNISFETNIIICEVSNITIENCSIKSTKKVADSIISIVFSQNILIDNCKITDSADFNGISINLNSIVEIKNTEISHIQSTLLVCAHESIVEVTNCNLHHSNGNGIYYTGQGNIQITNCTISDTRCPPIWVDEPLCCIRGCTIFNSNKDNGISINGSPQFSIEDNTIYKIKSSAISVRSEAKGTIKGNKISQIEGNGVYIEFSECELFENIFENCKFPAIVVLNQGIAVLRNNAIFGIDKCAIAGRNAKFIEIKENEIQKSLECGISLSGTEKCIIEGNKISNCSISAIESYNESNVFVKNNKISHIAKYAFLSYTAGQINAENNEIDDIGESMVKLVNKGRGEFVNNMVNNCKNQFENKTSSNFYFAFNGQFEGVTNEMERVCESVRFEQTSVNDDVVLCLKCNKNQRDCYIMKCGHRVYCTECAKLALDNHENCPLCRFPIIQVSEGFKMNNDDDDLCILCCENKPDSIIMPCGHTGVCSNCLNNWFKQCHVCPCCRTNDCYYNKIDTKL